MRVCGTIDCALWLYRGHGNADIHIAEHNQTVPRIRAHVGINPFFSWSRKTELRRRVRFHFGDAGDDFRYLRNESKRHCISTQIERCIDDIHAFPWFGEYQIMRHVRSVIIDEQNRDRGTRFDGETLHVVLQPSDGLDGQRLGSKQVMVSKY